MSLIEEFGKPGWLGFDTVNGQIVEQPYLKQCLLHGGIGKNVARVGNHYSGSNFAWNERTALVRHSEQKQKYLAAAISRGDAALCGEYWKPGGQRCGKIFLPSAKKVWWGMAFERRQVVRHQRQHQWLRYYHRSIRSGCVRTRRLSLFWVDLKAIGISRYKLNKDSWIPSDLTRIQMKDVFVSDEDLMDERGRELSHILRFFTNSRITISALALGTAAGAFRDGIEMRVKKTRCIWTKNCWLSGKVIWDCGFLFENEAAWMMMYRACWAKDQQKQDFSSGGVTRKIPDRGCCETCCKLGCGFIRRCIRGVRSSGSQISAGCLGSIFGRRDAGCAEAGYFQGGDEKGKLNGSLAVNKKIPTRSHEAN